MFACQGGRLGLRKGQDYYRGALICSAKGYGACSTVVIESVCIICANLGFCTHRKESDNLSHRSLKRIVQIEGSIK